MSMHLRMDPKALTVGDMEDFEEVAGVSILEVFSRLQVGGLTALPLNELKPMIWVIRRHEDPAFTLEQTREITLADLAAMEIEVIGFESAA